MTGHRLTLAVLTVFSVVLGCLQIAEEVLACACCARSDVWSRSIRGPNDFEYDEISKLSSLQGLLVEGVGERDHVFLEATRPLEISGRRDDRGTWSFIFRDADVAEDNATSLLFSPHGSWEFFMTYTGEWTGKIEPNVTLYKEVVIPGEVLVTGRLATLSGKNEHTAQLIFKGQGNRCFAHEDFEQWTLQFMVEESGGGVTFVGSGIVKNAADDVHTR